MRKIIELIDVNKQFERSGNMPVKVLHNINLSIAQGEMLAVTGRSGSGKSTLLHIMSGLIWPSSGKVLIDGQDISSFNDREISNFRNRQMGFVFQSFFLEPAFTAWENVALPLVIQKISSKKRKEMAREALERVGLSDRINHKPSEMSGGEMQRVCIARAIINSPKILFADEPTGNLDNANGDNIIHILREQSNQNTTVVLVTHDLDDASCCDRAINLMDGKII